MKKLMMNAAAATMGALFATSANAADLYAPPPVYAPPAPIWSWKGPYVGVYAGWAHSRTKATDLDGVEYDEFGGSDTRTLSDDDFFAGGTIGYNFQSGPWVFGPELELGYINNDKLVVFDEGQVAEPGLLTEYGFYGVAAGRVGYAVGRILPYAKGGLAFADIKNAGGEFDGKGDEGAGGKWGFDGGESGFGSDMRLGFAVGGGVEWAFADQWSVKAEYLFMDFGSKTYDGAEGDSDFKFKNRLHTVKVGVNWLF